MSFKRTRAAVRFQAHRSVPGVITAMALLGCAAQPAPIPEGTDTHWYGNIVVGEKFSVKIGDDFESSRNTLAGDGFRADGVFSCSENNGVVFICSSASQAFAPFRLRRFGKDGSVFLVVENSRVVRIVWSFSYVRIP